MRCDVRIVGGMFGLPDLPAETSSSPLFTANAAAFTVNARSAIRIAVEVLQPRKVWVPSFLCYTIIDGIRAASAPVEFYGVGYDLQISSYDWLRNVATGDLVVLIDYFGWPCDAKCADLARERGAWVLEDACQAMLSESAGETGDFAVISPRKYIGVPDGGILISNRNDVSFDDIRLAEPPGKWWMKAFSASVLRREFDTYGGTRCWFDLYREVDDEQVPGLCAMSGLSKMLLEQCFDYGEIARCRRSNYQALASELADIAVFPDLPDGVVPLGFPVRLSERLRVRQALFNYSVYPPIHWLIEDVVPTEYSDSHRLSSQILTIPCDQRYNDEDMQRINRIMREALAE